MYTDRILTCRDCGQNFSFTAGEQEFYASKGFTHEPTRCPDCRAAYRRSRDTGGGYGGSFGARERQMHSVTCAQCGKEALVPFLPRGDRPVYCSDCFDSIRGVSFSGPRG